MTQINISNLNNKGFTILRKWVDESTLKSINEVLPELFIRHKEIRLRNNNSIVSNEVAMNVLASDDIFIAFLQQMIDKGLIEEIERHYFKNTCILNSFSALSNIPSESKLFYKKFHRDIKVYSHEAPVFLNMLVMLDDFTLENGATLLLPFSHRYEQMPSQDVCENNCISMTGKAGDIVIWNGNIIHASGVNNTFDSRRALPITFTLPYYKQLLDYPRAIGLDRECDFSVKMRDLLGYTSRSPSTIEEWYRPKTS